MPSGGEKETATISIRGHRLQHSLEGKGARDDSSDREEKSYSAMTYKVDVRLVIGALVMLGVGYELSRATSSSGGGVESAEGELLEDAVSREVDRRMRTVMQGFKAERKIAYPPITDLARGVRKRILVTGGAGFVGSHLVDRLMEQGHEVTVVDSLFTGTRANVEHWVGHPHFTLLVHDVTEPILLEVDQIYHLACPASPPHYQFNPIKTIKTSTMGTLNMLGLAKRVRARMLFTSTSEVYGDPKEHPQKETYWGHVNPIGPRACYDEGKRVAETMMYAYQQQGGVDVRVARIFNTFGPRMNPADGRVVSNFIVQALQGHDITVYGDGKASRSFQYVDDLVAGLMALMASDYSQPVNIGNPDEYTISKFAQLVVSLTNSNSSIIYKPATMDDPQQRQPDITVAKRELGWQPRTTVQTGLRNTVEYFAKEVSRAGGIRTQGPGEFAAVSKPRQNNAYAQDDARRRE